MKNKNEKSGNQKTINLLNVSEVRLSYSTYVKASDRLEVLSSQQAYDIFSFY